MERSFDQYQHCESGCNHDLARGVLVRELLAGDGPHPVFHLVVNHPAGRGVLIRRGPAPLPAA